MEAQETVFLNTGDEHLAYQVFGSGPIDLVFVSGWFSHVDGIWEEPSASRFLRRLGSFARVILFDRRGTGASDPLHPSKDLSLEEWADDVRLVMEAAGSEQAAILANVDGGRMAMLYAAAHPDRVRALILGNATARFSWAEDYPCGVPPDKAEAFIGAVGQTWGSGGLLDSWAPSRKEDDRFKQWWSRYQRMSASPGTGQLALRTAMSIDVRHVLPAIHVPTLILHRRSNPLLTVEHGRFLRDRIAESRYIEIPGRDFFLFTEGADQISDEIEEFLTGARSSAEPDRVLATVLLTDIAGSTAHAARLGDRQWKDLLDAHDAATNRALAQYRGRLVKTTGDGILATFDGPARAIECARSIQTEGNRLGLHLRAGLHTGEVERRGEDVGGIAVHITARVAASAAADEVLVSRTVVDLVAGSGLRFDDRGEHELKGVPGTWRLFAVAT